MTTYADTGTEEFTLGISQDAIWRHWSLCEHTSSGVLPYSADWCKTCGQPLERLIADWDEYDPTILGRFS